MLERSHLAILREIERQGSLTKAAEVLCLTQPALTHAIKKLESLTGTTLWEKEGRNLRFTQAGLYLLTVANRILPQMEHADAVLDRMALGEQGSLRIGMECHPCYRWLLTVVEPYLQQWPKVDVDVKQKFQFGGMAALFAYEIDLLVTPDPLHRDGVQFVPVFDYEQVLVVAKDHPLASRPHVLPEDLRQEVLLTYPVDIERLDIFSEFLLPANCLPARQKTLEATDIMLQMVAAGRGVAALPDWLAADYATRMPVQSVRLGEHGIAKSIFIGMREGEQEIKYLSAFVALAARNLKASVS